MTETGFEALVEVLENIRGSSSKRAKISLAAEFLRAIPSDEISDVVRLMVGQPYPGRYGALDLRQSDIADALSAGEQQKIFSQPLTIRRVAQTLREISSISGKDSRRRKATRLRGIMSDASGRGREFLLGMITGEMRTGFSEGLMLETLVKISLMDKREVSDLLSMTGDIGALAEELLGGSGSDARLKMEPMRPLRPMLAESAPDVAAALDALGTPTAMEYKLDGVRVQIHKSHGRVRIFSRRLADITDAVPDAVMQVDSISATNLILDGEIIAFSDRPLPFQDVMRRVTRERGVADEAMHTPVRLFLFDLLFFDGKETIGLPYEARRKMLEDISPSHLTVPRRVVRSVEEAEEFFSEAMTRGHEGIVAKSLTGQYQLGRRDRTWLKVKKVITLDLVIIGAERGHGRRSPWLSDYHLGVRNKEGYLMVGKTFKGLTDDEFDWMTRRLESLTVEDRGDWLAVRPEVVVEVAFNEIQKSSKYGSGLALRFARVTAIREDKDPKEVATIEELRDIYEGQFSYKARSLK